MNVGQQIASDLTTRAGEVLGVRRGHEAVVSYTAGRFVCEISQRADINDLGTVVASAAFGLDDTFGLGLFGDAPTFPWSDYDRRG